MNLKELWQAREIFFFLKEILWYRYFNRSTAQRTRKKTILLHFYQLPHKICLFQWSRCMIHLKRIWNRNISWTNNIFSNLPSFQDTANVWDGINVYSSCLTVSNIFYNMILRQYIYSRISNQSIIISRNGAGLSNPENSFIYVKRFICWSRSRFSIDLFIGVEESLNRGGTR